MREFRATNLFCKAGPGVAGVLCKNELGVLNSVDKKFDDNEGEQRHTHTSDLSISLLLGGTPIDELHNRQCAVLILHAA